MRTRKEKETNAIDWWVLYQHTTMHIIFFFFIGVLSEEFCLDINEFKCFHEENGKYIMYVDLNFSNRKLNNLSLITCHNSQPTVSSEHKNNIIINQMYTFVNSIGHATHKYWLKYIILNHSICRFHTKYHFSCRNILYMSI